MSAPRAQVLLPVLALGALPQLWLAVSDQGVFWPDEIYQSLEQAHRFAFGFGVIPWEFAEGARSWLLPGAVGLFWNPRIIKRAPRAYIWRCQQVIGIFDETVPWRRLRKNRVKPRIYKGLPPKMTSY